jgi:subtilase family serine protease
MESPSTPRRRKSPYRTLLLASAAALAAHTPVVHAQRAGAPLIVQRIDDANLTRLAGNVSGLARPSGDIGSVPASFPLNNLMLVLKRSPAQQLALEQFLKAQQDPHSALFHQRLTPDEFGARFGATDADVQAISAWLQRHGFQVKGLSRGRNVLRFSATAGAVESNLHTQIHFFNVQGERHFSNVSDPQLPSAMAAAVAGIVGLHDFRPKPQLHRLEAQRTSSLLATPQFNAGASNGYGVTPTDFATIYNVKPLLSSGITGAGETIAIVGQSNINTATPKAYWSAFGISKGQSLQVVVPQGMADPGETSDPNEEEADLDVEIAGGIAQSAHIIFIPAVNVLDAIQYAIDQNVAPILSISFGGCEFAQGSSGNAAINALYQQASAQQMTVVVASGDQGSAGCDASGQAGPAPASQGLAVNGLASTPYDTAVGGTDFNYPLLKHPPLSLQDIDFAAYWGPSNTLPTFSDALSYIPEMAWNDSCANPVLLQYLPTYSSVEALCNDPANSAYATVSGGSGGLSSCTTLSGNPAACTGGYPQPSWQAGILGMPAANARAVPDVSFFAAVADVFFTSWVVCGYGNTTCDPNGSAGAADGYDLIGGTSASTPAFAGIVALLLQTQASPANPDGRQGLLNPRLYQLASLQNGTAQSPNATMLTACNSSTGNAVGSSCIFHDVTAGGNAQPCTTGSVDCVTQTNGDTYGITGTGGSALYPSGTGYDAATGLGSLNAANFVAAWTAPGISLTAGAIQSVIVKSSVSVSFTLTGTLPLTVTPTATNLSGVALSAGCGTSTSSCSATGTSSATPGPASLSLAVADNFGQSATGLASITVTKPPPPTITIHSGGTQSAVADAGLTPVAFTLTGVAPLTVTSTTADLSSVVLSAGCGTTTMSCTATLGTAPQPGTATLMLQVADAYAQSASTSATVSVTAPPAKGGGAMGLQSLLGLAALGGLRLLRARRSALTNRT